jgi:hypothetical protein
MRRGIFGTLNRKDSAALVVQVTDSVDVAAISAGACLALGKGEYHVFRAVLLSIVLTLAVGQNASLLCEVWCHDATVAACPHQSSATSLDSTTSPGVQADDNCGSLLDGPVALVREDGRRPAPRDTQTALVVPWFRSAPSPTDVRPGFESGRQLPREERPLVTTLRL